MTTYATTTAQQGPPLGGPPAPPPRIAGGPPTRRTPRPRPAGIIAAATAFVIAAGATVATAAALVSPVTPAQHTVNVVPPAPVRYGDTEIEAAKQSACLTWDISARTIASVGKTRATLGENTGGSSNDTEEARAVEKRTVVAELQFLRNQIAPATPARIRYLIDDWMALQIDSMHSAVVRDWKASNAATDKGNDLVDVIVPACGLR
ncbi:hypothetical protein Mycch_5550 (plasmid) [Mycolicibacterium chubuense NBB4]|uniref:Uncharacterized protein n=1 Tax=Mycolicibacterium chubuense (strain NBB4) TaxID=710421 RepID=I4BSF8_MYCCN|nr:hypothetical protein [Mycolicibacterium chubuense]AFM20215.1 hypothetical protein Mycch_5550 [Mycolicibacterium chubuense NBB4]